MQVQGPFEKYLDWGQCATVMQKEMVTVMPSCSGGMIFIPLAIIKG